MTGNITLTPLGPTGPARLNNLDPSVPTTNPGSPFSPYMHRGKRQMMINLFKYKTSSTCVNPIYF